MNINNRTAAVALVAILALGVLPGARAAQVGFYVGGNVGQADKDGKIEDFDNSLVVQFVQAFFEFAPASTTSTLDESDSAYGFLAGYRFTPHLAVEGAFMDIGTLKYRNRSSGTFLESIPGDLNQNIDSETNGIAVSGLGILPISYRWEVYGRLGALFASNDLKVFVDTPDDIFGPDQSDVQSESSIDMLAGVGTSFNFLEIYDARLEYTRIFDAGDEATGEGDVNLFTLGITVSF